MDDLQRMIPPSAPGGNKNDRMHKKRARQPARQLPLSWKSAVFGPWVARLYSPYRHMFGVSLEANVLEKVRRIPPTFYFTE
jgi:hypothetical protein